jgi:hypothetical protein
MAYEAMFATVINDNSAAAHQLKDPQLGSTLANLLWQSFHQLVWGMDFTKATRGWLQQNKNIDLARSAVPVNGMEIRIFFTIPRYTTVEKNQYGRIRRPRLIAYHHNLHMWYTVIYIDDIDGIRILLKILYQWHKQNIWFIRRQRCHDVYVCEGGGTKSMSTVVEVDWSPIMVTGSLKSRFHRPHISTATSLMQRSNQEWIYPWSTILLGVDQCIHAWN